MRPTLCVYSLYLPKLIMISLLITLEIDPAGVADFVKFITEEAADALAHEPGCHRFEISRSLEQPNVFTLAELYADQAALDAHRLTPHFLLFKKRATAAGFVLRKTAVLGEVLPLE